MTAFGKDLNLYTIYLSGRIHLTDITKNYKEYQKTNWDESNTITDPSAEEEFIAYDRNNWDVEISDESAIIRCYPRQYYLSAIAAVDYAMRETKPSCGLVTEFKIISK